MIEIFGLQFSLYGLMIGFAIVVGAKTASLVSKREGVSEDEIWDGLVWVVGLGLVGARVYHVVDLWSYYSQNLLEVFYLWHGGLGIWGGILGGVVGLLVYRRWGDKGDKGDKGNGGDRLWKYLDVAAFGVPVGQAIGRLGNFFNQELYGYPTYLPWE